MEGLSGVKVVPHPVFHVRMNGKDVTAVLSPYLLSVTYTDHEEGEADTLDIRVEDVEGKFRGPWYPQKGQTLSLEFGYEGHPLQKAGDFEIDELEGDGPPDVISIKGIAAGIKTPHRTIQGKAYENTTLAAIVQQIARRLKKKLIGKIEPIKIARVTQIYESDVVFLRRLASEYGYAFSARGDKLIFYKKSELDKGAVVLKLDRADLSRYHIRDKIMGIPSEVSVAYHDTKTKRLKHYKVRNDDRATSSDAVKSNVRATSSAQAKAKASAALAKANEAATLLDVTIEGNPKLVAGVNFELTGFGKLGGIFHVVKSRHEMDRNGGYRTDAEARRIKPAVTATVKTTGAKNNGT